MAVGGGCLVDVSGSAALLFSADYFIDVFGVLLADWWL